MSDILKPFLCVLVNALLALGLMLVFDMPLAVVLIVSFAGFALSFYAAPGFGSFTEVRADKTGGGSLFCWFVIFGAIIVPAAFICLEFSKYNFRGQRADDVLPSEIEKYAAYDYFYFAEIRPLPQFAERLCKTTKSGKTGSTTSCYNAFPVTDGKADGVYKVWAVYDDYEEKIDFEGARSGIRVNSDRERFLETAQKAAQKFNLKSAENPVFITLTHDAERKLKENVRTMIFAFAVCVLVGTAAKGYLMYLARKS